jgi:predicted sugar kinase
VDVKSLSWIRQIDRFAAAKVCYWILMDFIPALKQQDLKSMGDVIYNIMLCGPKGIPILTYHGSADLLDTILHLRKEGIEIAFISSAGPGLVAITKDKAEIAKKVFKSHKCKIIELEPDNEGLKVIEAI